MQVRSVGICLKPDQPQAAGTVRGLVKWLEEHQVSARLDDEAADQTGGAGGTRAEIAAEVDLLVVLGGDGTLLSVARESGERAVPILGVNLGTLGFLTEIALDEMFAAMERVLRGEMPIESRMRLDLHVIRGDETLGRYQALNDAVIANAMLARMVDLVARVDGMQVTHYHADGLIVATPTGSTAYSLSAGGPIVDARLEAFVLTPISPHTLTQRPVVIPGDSTIEVEPRGGELQLSVDGQVGLLLRAGDVVRVTRSDHPVRLVVSPFRNHFEVLREKLHWGTR